MLVHKLRLQRGWSQQQLADLSGLSKRTIQRIEGGAPATPESLKALASVFEIDFSALMKEDIMTESPVTDRAEQLALVHVRKLKGFYLHVFQYVVVVAVLAVVNLATRPHFLWVLFVVFGWGSGLLVHAARIFNLSPFNANWERRQVEKHVGRNL